MCVRIHNPEAMIANNKPNGSTLKAISIPGNTLNKLTGSVTLFPTL